MAPTRGTAPPADAAPRTGLPTDAGTSQPVPQPAPRTVRYTDDVPDAATALHRGGLVAMPTETVYGLAADAEDATAVARVFAVKGRPTTHPLIVHVRGHHDLDAWTVAVPEYARALARACWPGPLTLVLRRSALAGDHVTGGQDTVAVRAPDHPVAQALLEAFVRLGGRGLAAPSANRFGRVSPTCAEHVLAELGEVLDPELDLVLDGGRSGVGVESTILDCTGPRPRILRPGAIDADRIAQVCGVRPLGPGAGAEDGPAAGEPAEAGVPGNGDRNPGNDGRNRAGNCDHDGERRPDKDRGRNREGARSLDTGTDGDAGAEQVRVPGNLAAHYAPRAEVLLVEADELADLTVDPDGGTADLSDRTADPSDRTADPSDRTAGQGSGTAGATPDPGPGASRPRTGLLAPAGVTTPPGVLRLASPVDAGDFARLLYAVLREADDRDLRRILVVPPPATGIGVAVRDRLRRAAVGSAR